MQSRTPEKISQRKWEQQAEALLELAEDLAGEEEPAVGDLAQVAADCVLLLWPGLAPAQVIRSLKASLAAGTPLVAGPESLEQALEASRATTARGWEQAELDEVLVPQLDDLLEVVRRG